MTSTADPASTDDSRAVPVTAGIVCALVGFTSSFAIVLAGLQSVGADRDQSASGLLVVSLLSGAGILWLALRHRVPITLAWSTPGAALLITTGEVDGGWPAAVGAFAVTGLLIAASGVWTQLADLVRRIPPVVAQAMLAGILLPLCTAPVPALREEPWAVAPVLLTWLALVRFTPRWAVPAAFVAAAVVIAVDLVSSGATVPVGDLAPQLTWTTPAWTTQALVGLAIPLFVVTMASQNIAGVAVMQSFGYRVPWRETMAVTGLGTVLGAGSGGHAVNLSAISAALAAGPDAGPDPSRRWIAAVSDGVTFLVLGLASAALATLVALAPAGVVQAVAAVALLGAFVGALGAALADPQTRTVAATTFVVAGSGIAFAGVGSAFWALVVGIAVHLVLRPRSR